MARRGIVPFLGDGSQELSIVHAADLADALVAAATSPATVNRTYHAAHAAIVTQRRLLEEIGRTVGRTPRFVRMPPLAVRLALSISGALARATGRTTLLDPAKAPELLAPAWTCLSDALQRDAGWRASIPLDRGLRETADWYTAAGWL
jgi:nucleoside-diphosphate-sugar epimerase